MAIQKKGQSKFANKKQKPVEEEPYSDNDEVDKFYQQRSKIMLDDEEQDHDNASDSEEAVFGLGSEEDDSEDDFDQTHSNDDDDEGEGEGEEEEEEEDDDDDDDENADAMTWGKHKKTYYSADVKAEKEEAAEALRLQRSQAAMMIEEDYGALDSISEADSEPEPESETTSNALTPSIISKSNMAAFASSHADFVRELTSDYRDKMCQIKETLQPIIDKANTLPTSHGLSFLQVKYHLLLSYCTNICFFMLLKCHGKKVEGHPVVEALVKLRAQLEKLKPIETKLKHQIDRLLTTALSGEPGQGDADALSHKPRLHQLVSKDGHGETRSKHAAIAQDKSDNEDAEAMLDHGGLYRPPKLAPVYFEDKASRTKRKEQVSLESERRSRLLRELRDSDSDMAPEEEVDDLTAFHKSSSKDKARTSFEEEHFTRMSMSKKELKASQQLQKYKLSNVLDELNDFAIMQSDSDDDLRQHATRFGKNKAAESRSSASAAAALDSKHRKRGRQEDSDESIDSDALSDDEDGMHVQRRSSQGQDDDDNDDDNDDGEDEFYKSVKNAKKPKSSAKGIQPSRDYDPYHDKASGAKRPANYRIIKNKGLMPSRSKDQRNPRLKQRHRYEKAEKKIKGFKRSVASHTKGAPYQGERTGIRTHLTKSVKFA